MSDPRSVETSPDVSVAEDETMPTTLSDDAQSEAAFSSGNVPNAPNNTPAGTVGGTIPDLDRFYQKSSSLWMTSSAAGSAGDAHDSSELSILSPQTTASSHVHEGSFWAEAAEEEIKMGLYRLYQAAKDECKVHPEKIKKEIFHERLAKLVKSFDAIIDSGSLDEKEEVE